MIMFEIGILQNASWCLYIMLKRLEFIYFPAYIMPSNINFVDIFYSQNGTKNH